MSHSILRLTHLDEPDLRKLAIALAATVESGVIYLEGELGAGKTTFARALLQTLGVGERIKSPTYSLIESYITPQERYVNHLDLYRIADPEELEWLGIPELAGASSLMLVEWPERGGGALPTADLSLRLKHAGIFRDLEVEAATQLGEQLLSVLRRATADLSGR